PKAPSTFGAAASTFSATASTFGAAGSTFIRKRPAPSAQPPAPSSESALHLRRSRKHPSAQPSVLSLRIESIADPRFGDEITRIRWIGLELLPQLPHEHAQVLRLLLRGLAPHRLEQRAVRDHAIRM